MHATPRLLLRQHVNPLSRAHQRVVALPPTWLSSSFSADPSLPFHLDIGCGDGQFVLGMAKRHHGSLNVLGLEIRQPLIDRHDGAEGVPENAGFLACNANTHVAAVLEHINRVSCLAAVSVNFPDPWFKARYVKRRVIQPPLVQTLAEGLRAGGQLVVQTDVADLMDHAEGTIRNAAPGLHGPATPGESPFGVQTLREKACIRDGLQIYRAVWTKRDA